MKKILYLLTLLLSLSLSWFSVDAETIVTDLLPSQESQDQSDSLTSNTGDETSDEIDRNGFYTTAEEVALYIQTYMELPNNYITKREAFDLGLILTQGNLWEITDHKSLGGDIFHNKEELLPQAEGRIYYECDINYQGGNRGAERIIFSNDGLIFYTDDHYESFTLMYGEL